MRVCLDTCIIIDYLQHREPFFENAHKLFLAVANRIVEGCITSKSVADIYYLMHQVLHDNEKVRNILGVLLSLFTILDTTEIDCRRALLSNINDYEDAMMVETAERYNIKCIVTRNLKDFVGAKVQAVLPNDFILLLKTQNKPLANK